MAKKNTYRALHFLSMLLIASISLCSQEVGRPDAHQQSRFPLHEAVAAGDIGTILLLLSYGFPVDARDNTQQTPLHIAVKNNNLQIVACLVGHGALVNAQDSTGKTPFHVACENGDMEIVTYLFSIGPDMLAQDKNSMTPLHYASEKGHIDIVKFLIDTLAVSTLNNSNSKGDSPLHLAIKNGHIEVVRVLLRAGADIESHNNDRQTPLHVAAHNGHTEVVRCLLRAWKLIEARAADGECSEGDDESSDKDCESLDEDNEVRDIEDNSFDEESDSLDEDDASMGEDDDSSDEDDLSPSQDRGLVNTKDNEGNTPLHLACKKGHLEVARCLLHAGADIEARATFRIETVGFGDFPGKTAVLLASINNHGEIVKLLIQHGAELNEWDSDDYEHAIPLYYAIRNGNLDIVQHLIKAGAETKDIGLIPLENALHHAAGEGTREIVEFFIKETPEDIDARDDEENTPLHLTAQRADGKHAPLLVNAGAQIRPINKEGKTPLEMILENLKDSTSLLAKPCKRDIKVDIKVDIAKLRASVKFFVELGMDISPKEKELLDDLCPEYPTWLANRKKFVQQLFEDTLQLPGDIAQLLHEFIFKVEKKRKRDAEIDQESNKKSRN